MSTAAGAFRVGVVAAVAALVVSTGSTAWAEAGRGEVLWQRATITAPGDINDTSGNDVIVGSDGPDTIDALAGP